MKIIKRSGQEMIFDRSKIINAVTKANLSVSAGKRLTKKQIEQIGVNVENIANKRRRALSVEEIQDIVENEIMDLKCDITKLENLLGKKININPITRLEEYILNENN